MNVKVLLLLALVAAAAAAAARPSYGDEDSYGDSYQDAKYEFKYEVKDNDGNDFGHSEQRDGELTEGFFFTLLPDGRIQTTKYIVDGPSGFLADVSFDGEAKYDSGSREYYRPSFRSGYRSSERY